MQAVMGLRSRKTDSKRGVKRQENASNFTKKSMNYYNNL